MNESNPIQEAVVNQGHALGVYIVGFVRNEIAALKAELIAELKAEFLKLAQSSDRPSNTKSAEQIPPN